MRDSSDSRARRAAWRTAVGLSKGGEGGDEGEGEEDKGEVERVAAGGGELTAVSADEGRGETGRGDARMEKESTRQ
jgi:hypothetical protein